jgi:predicted house-cleaning NTP pyrophosphatase (Maf/HAM1 superfamily)
MITAIIISLSVLVVTLGYTTFNLLRKNEKAEDVINSYQVYIKDVSETIEFIDNRLEEIDQNGAFKSDDEVGFFFERVKVLHTALKSFKVDL